MLRSNSNLGFPRKVVGYYLLFCMVAVVWLATGLLLTSHTVLDSRTTNACLSRLGKTAAALEIEYLRNGAIDLQKALKRNQWSSDQVSYSIVSPEGTVLADTNPSSVGKPAQQSQGNQLRWGDVTGIQYQDDQGQVIHEYHVPLIAHKDHFGSLQIRVQQLNFVATLKEIARVSPAVLLVPLGLILAGAWLLVRLTRPVAGVEAQLRRLALERMSGSNLELQPLAAKDATSVGWNRIVDFTRKEGSADGGEDLNSRLAGAIAARQENELQDVLHNLSDGVAVTNLEGRITFANRAVTALLGSEIDANELTGIELEGHILNTLDDTSDGTLFENPSPLRPAIAEVQREGEASERTLRVARSPLAGESLRGHVWSLRDVTQQKLTEKTRDQFIDVATHELRTPLSNIKAYAETLATCDSIEIEEQKEFCNIINSEVTRLARFVDDLLSISSMESGALSIERQRTISARLFEEVLDKVRPLMEQKQIEFIVDLPEKMADLQVDKDKVVAVLVNLLGNAAKYTPTGGRVLLRVKLDEGQLQIFVEDTGVGIADEELPKVFEKFFRSNDPRVQAETGTGLGLALAREVVRMHGGDITVESQVDQGTTFVATFPAQ